MSHSSSVAPRFAKARAVARPMPDAAPVIRTFLFFKLVMGMVVSVGRGWRGPGRGQGM
ncbi:hypothetical protein FQZ97_1171550 [compost metagenome]